MADFSMPSSVAWNVVKGWLREDRGMSDIQIVPNPGQNYEGRQWGFTIEVDGRPYLEAIHGGTGACWNFRDPTDEEGPTLHFCDLDDLIAALTTLRDSGAHTKHVERWGRE